MVQSVHIPSGAVVIMIIWYLDLQLHVQSVPIYHH